LWTAFGAETLATAREEPALVAAQIRGIGPERAERIAAALRVAHGSEAAEVALRAILATAGCGSSPRQIQRLLERYGAAAAEVVRADPYRLIREIHGIGWAIADAIGRAVGISAGEPRRIRAAVLHLLESEAEGSGDTYAEVAWLLRRAPELLGGGVQGLEVAREIGALTTEEAEGAGEGGSRGAELVIWVRAASDYERAIGLGVPVAYRARTWAAERAVADALGRLASRGESEDDG
jgi:ATP-dependent exoDNAse (exonuclease V) alpha subunit